MAGETGRFNPDANLAVQCWGNGWRLPRHPSRDFFFHWWGVKSCGVLPGNVQGLLVTLHSGITPGGTTGILGLKPGPEVSEAKAHCPSPTVHLGAIRSLLKKHAVPRPTRALQTRHVLDHVPSPQIISLHLIFSAYNIHIIPLHLPQWE